ncbi:MAG: tetratricopeptide repeat protein [Bacteroidales bacterium]|nr:tetratricopeptide repeat protein [Bacteroidales bacterium]
MKQHKTLYAAAVLMLTLISSRAAAINEHDWGERLESARKLYYSGSFYAAEKAFDELSASIDGRNELKQSEIEAYKVLCAIALDRVNIDGMVKVFSDKYPNAPELSMVRYALASNYFDRGRYDEAEKILVDINEQYLYKAWRVPFRFKRGFSQMTQGHREAAAKDFSSIIDMKASRYMYPSLYYLGYVYYLDRRFDDACGLFVKAAADAKFTKMSSYYLLESKFMTKDYYYVVDKGPEVYEDMEEDLRPNVARILSESYYSLGDADQARKYMDIYENSATSISRKDHYYSAMLAYSLKSWSRAVSSFSQVTGEKDSLGQSAHYYRAHSQLCMGNKLAAMDDFKAASAMDFDPVVTEDAFFNFAKLSFDVNADISQFEKYNELYPSSGRADIVNNYMAMSFLDRKDYATAMELLDRIAEPTAEVSANLQKASFLRAMQFANQGAWRSAVPVFEKSISAADNDGLKNLARFWEAECLFRDGQYAEAAAINGQITSDKAFRRTPEYPMALYNLAYCHFQNGEYDKAQKGFSDYLACSDTYFEKDARIRLADSHYMQNDYDTAASIYEGVVDAFPGSDDIYPNLQAALAYGLSGSENKKMELLGDAVRNHSNAALYPKALYELGTSYIHADNQEEASRCFYELLGVKSDSTYQTRAMLSLALINSNEGKYSKALEYYRNVALRCKGTDEGRDALAGMENIYRILNKPSEYLAFLDESGLSSTKSESERGSMVFDAAQQLYNQGNYSSAVNALMSYISQYPDAPEKERAGWLLAEALQRTGRKEAASDAYQRVIDAGGRYLEPALGSFAQLNYELERYDRAAKAYRQLASVSTMEDVRCEALSGRMRCDYRTRNYTDAIAAADSVLSFTSSAEIVLREARYIKAKSLMSYGDRDQAMDIFAKLSANVADPFGAESQYLLIFNDFNAGDFESVEEKTYAFSESGTQQMYWLAKSFIVLGDSFVARGENEQAMATYKSIADGYDASVDDDIIPTAKARLAKIK